MGKHFYWTKNGDIDVQLWEGNCLHCGRYVHESYPHEDIGEDVMCADCAYITGRWTEKEFIKNACFFAPVTRAVIHDGEIWLADDNYKFPWEKTKKEQRHDSAYNNWRLKVFERDNYTCAICGQHGGTLNAHHIKSFKDYPKFRLDIDNGITFCVECHRKVHKEQNSEWIYSDKQKHIE